MTGYAGNASLKLYINEEMSAFDVVDAFEQMCQKNWYVDIRSVILERS